MSTHLERLAGRAAADPFFLAGALSAYARSEALDDAGLAARLGCTPTVLTLLRLCRAPRPEAPVYLQDVARIAARFNLDGERLAEAARQGQALLCLQDPAAGRQDSAAGFLLAARDRPADSPDPPRGDSP
jgi:hypothetical protein